MKYITKKLKELVTDEATKLRKHATQKERLRLNFESFSPRYPQSCVYGQMTYACRSKRAVELLDACAIPFADNHNPSFINDKSYSGLDKEFEDTCLETVYSPIEVYICFNGRAKNEHLLAYIRGDVDKLEL
jgi:hypothetical protein